MQEILTTRMRLAQLIFTRFPLDFEDAVTQDRADRGNDGFSDSGENSPLPPSPWGYLVNEMTNSHKNWASRTFPPHGQRMQ